jgi:hypothetical protein
MRWTVVPPHPQNGEVKVGQSPAPAIHNLRHSRPRGNDDYFDDEDVYWLPTGGAARRSMPEAARARMWRSR